TNTRLAIVSAPPARRRWVGTNSFGPSDVRFLAQGQNENMSSALMQPPIAWRYCGETARVSAISRRRSSYFPLEFMPPHAKLAARLLHHLPDLVGNVLGQAQRLAHDLVDLFPGGAVDHQVALLACGEERRIGEHRLKRAAQRREPVRRHPRSG